MLALIQQGQWALFGSIVIALVISLSFHEFGHAWVAKRFGDNTAELAGRLTINPRVFHWKVFALCVPTTYTLIKCQQSAECKQTLVKCKQTADCKQNKQEKDTENSFSYGNFLLLGLIVLAFMGIPVFESILGVSRSLLPLVIFVPM